MLAQEMSRDLALLFTCNVILGRSFYFPDLERDAYSYVVAVRLTGRNRGLSFQGEGQSEQLEGGRVLEKYLHHTPSER